jgi:hypothetical protein
MSALRIPQPFRKISALIGNSCYVRTQHQGCSKRWPVIREERTGSFLAARELSDH